MSNDGIRDIGQVELDVQAKPEPARDTDHTSRVRKSFSQQQRIALREKPPRDDIVIDTPPRENEASGPLSDRRWDTPGCRDTDGGPIRQARGRGDHRGPNFSIDVCPNGYAWWYIDGISAEGGRAISIIAFIGSVFSPWYRWSGRKDPFNNVCINVATYGPGGKFCMTDRGRSALRASEDVFEVGPSKLSWDGKQLTIDINELGAPPTLGRVRGQVIVRPHMVTDIEVLLTTDGAHIWRPFAPSADIEVRLEQSGWSWDGHGYFDANFGTAALEDDFSYWTWGRFPHSMGSVCFYDANRRDGTDLSLGLLFEKSGNIRLLNPPPKTRFKRSLWQVRRETRADAGYMPRQVEPMLDAPFYNRAQVKTQFAGEEIIGVHESLDLNRFRTPWLKPMLAVRVPRRPGWTFGD